MLPKFLINHNYAYSWVCDYNALKTYCNISLRCRNHNLDDDNNNYRTTRIDTIGISNPVNPRTFDSDKSKLVIVFWNPYSFWEVEPGNPVLLTEDNMHAQHQNYRLAKWIEQFVMSSKGIQTIFQRVLNFDYYKLLEQNYLIKNEIIHLAYNSEDLDDDSV